MYKTAKIRKQCSYSKFSDKSSAGLARSLSQAGKGPVFHDAVANWLKLDSMHLTTFKLSGSSDLPA